MKNVREGRSFFYLPFTLIKKRNLLLIEAEHRRLNAVMECSLSFIQQMKTGVDDTKNDQQLLDHPLLEELVAFRETLERIKRDEQQQKWTNEGLAHFIEILRNDTNDLSKLGDSIISALVKYVGLNQGGLFLTSDTTDDVCLEMLSCYAYERKKFLKKQISVGEGLLGQAFLEKQTVYITEIPQEYVTITSGLGHATPRCLLIVPLVVKDNVMGMMELASFTPLAPYQIRFIEKLAENLASTISSVRINQRTALMLRESQLQTEELNAQDEEMRQNVEELQSIQEELARKSKELEKIHETEKERTEKQLESQKKIMEKVSKNFQVKEQNYKNRIEELEAMLDLRKGMKESPTIL
jgi:hypothetical protein